MNPSIVLTNGKAQNEFARALATSAVGPMCVIKNLTSGVDVFGGGGPTDSSNCTLRVHWDAINFTVCPLELLPCVETEIEHVIRATERAIDLIPQIIFYPSNFSEEVLDRVICELETATAAIEVSFEGRVFTQPPHSFTNTKNGTSPPTYRTGRRISSWTFLPSWPEAPTPD
jgi:hypothetical protein